MANNTSTILKFLQNKYKKYKVSNRVGTLVANTVNKTRNRVVNSINDSPLYQELQKVPTNPTNPMPNRLVTWWQWYQQLVGLDTLEKAKNEVLLTQDKLTKCQEIRRYLRQEAFLINNKTKEIYSELLITRRDDPKYVNLTVLENKNLQEFNTISQRLNLLEEEEKDYFVNLTTAIKEYHDAQTVNSQKYKYISILSSAIAAILSLLLSMIYNNKRLEEIKKLQEEQKFVIVDGLKNFKNHVTEELSKISLADAKPSNEQSQDQQSKWDMVKQGAVYVLPAIWMLKSLVGL